MTAAGAVPLLHLFGTVTGGWLVARQALAAQAKTTAEGDPTGFYAAKIELARHYARHILPHCAGLFRRHDRGIGHDARL